MKSSDYTVLTVEESFNKLKREADIRSIHPLVHNFLYSMISKEVREHFCTELLPEVSQSFDIDCENKLCYRFWGNNKYDNEMIQHINNKSNNTICNECWARNFCFICVANELEEMKGDIPDKTSCDKQKQFEMIIVLFVSIAKEEGLEVVISIMDNYYEGVKYEIS